MGFSFLLRNFPDFDRFLLILAKNLLTSSLFLNFLDVFWKYLWKWVFLPKFIKIAFSFWKYEGGANLHQPPKMGVSETPPKIGLKLGQWLRDVCFVFTENHFSKKTPTRSNVLRARPTLFEANANNNIFCNTSDRPIFSALWNNNDNNIRLFCIVMNPRESCRSWKRR